MTFPARCSGLISVATAFLVSGCATTNFYPLCVYGPAAGLESQDQLRREINEFVAVTTAGYAKTAISSNQRIVAVETESWRHQKLRLVWPRMACIGPSRYDKEYKDYRQCVSMVEDALSHGGLPTLGVTSDGLGGDTLFCGQGVQ